MTPKKTAVIYVRCSTQDQLRGSSLDRQYRYCKMWCEWKDVEIIRVLADVGSGYDGYHLGTNFRSEKKGNLGKWMRGLEDKVCVPDYFIYEEGDRFCMSPLIRCHLAGILREHGVTPLTVGMYEEIDWKVNLTEKEKQQIYQA